MTEMESRLYELSEKAETMSIDLQETLHQIFYDPESATGKDIEGMTEIIGILEKATELAAGIEKHLHG